MFPRAIVKQDFATLASQAVPAVLSSNPRAAAEAFIALHPTWRAVPPLAARPQVWYCTIKGYKPWQQPDAKNTKTNEEGGQTIWYDEAQLLQVQEGPTAAPSLARAGRRAAGF